MLSICLNLLYNVINLSDVWNVYGQCENVMVMKGHTGAIMELCFSPDGSHLYTCATDNTVAVWDVPTGVRIKKLKGHANFVNSVSGKDGSLKKIFEHFFHCVF